MPLGTRIFTLFKGRLVGRDQYGNRYYQERGAGHRRRQRRWVLYDGEVEASRVPPEWRAWLHHTVAEPPLEQKRPKRAWQKEHQPNLTGTARAYRPPGHDLEGGRRPRTSDDYEPWQPS